MERWWNGTDGGNDYGALVEWFRRVEMYMERWWNGTDGGNEYGALVE